MNGSPCKDSSSCNNGGICTMTYADENKSVPLGRFCKGGENPENEIVSCRVDSDCPKGECVVVKDDDGRFVGRQCLEDGEAVREGDYKKIDPDGTKYPHNKHISMERINDKVTKANGGPVAKMIVELITLIFAVIDQMLFLVRNIFWGVFHAIGGPLLQIKGDLSILMLDTITKRLIPKNKVELDKCRADNSCPNCYSLWLVRNIYTILIPPYGVFMTTGIFGVNRLRKILISCILTACFYFPGLIYSLIIVNNNKYAEEEKKLTRCRHQGKEVKNTYSKEKVKILGENINDSKKTLLEVF